MPGMAPFASRPSAGGPEYPSSRALAGGALAVVLLAGLNKALLFHNLEYYASDLYTFLEMTWSWLYSGLILHDNNFGFHGAIHNFYGLLAFAPLTIAFGAYGLILGLVLAHGLATVRVASCRWLDGRARLVILGGYLGPVAFYVFDNTEMGFHPELLYPPLALLLAVELLDGWTWRSVAVSAAIVLVKEDGAVVCAAIVVAHTLFELMALQGQPKTSFWPTLRRGLVALAAFGVIFAGGMVLLAVMSEHYGASQSTASSRGDRALRLALKTLSGRGPEARWFRIRDSLQIYGAMTVLILLPLGRRLPRGLLLTAAALPPLLAVLLVSSAVALFNMMLWAPRVATVQSAVVAALVFAAIPLAGQSRPRWRLVWVLIGLSWAGQVAVLGHMKYPLGARWSGLTSLIVTSEPALPPGEEDFLRCVAGRVPRGLPVIVPRPVRPIFHLQSVIPRKKREHRALNPARLHVRTRDETASGRIDGFCVGPSHGEFAVEAECDLVQAVAGCSTQTAER